MYKEKGQTTIYETLHRKLKSNRNPTKNMEWTQVLRNGNLFLLHM